MPLKTAEDFLSVLERSNLLSPAEFAKARELSEGISDATQLAKTLAREEILTYWQAGQVLAGRSTFFLGRYKLIQLLGRGGMGGVFLAEHVVMHRRVALKHIPRHIAKNPAALEHFLAEARTIAALDHTNIVRAYSVDNDEASRYYLVMEYVDGLDLQHVLEENGPLDCESVVDCIHQAAEGLAHAHARNMIHCDIKPSNLILNEQGVVKILDMGLARLVGREKTGGGESSDPEKQILGSVDYLAPEQAMASPDFNHRADLYALGCTMYFLLTGHPPFPEGTLAQRIVKHQTQEPSEIGVERPDVPANLIAICKKMMAKDPADRYQSAVEVSDALANWMPEVPQTVKKPIAIKKIEPIEALIASSPWELDFGDDIKNLAAASGSHEFGFPPGSSGSMPAVKNGTSSVKLMEMLAGTRQRLILTSCTVAVLLVLILAGIILPFVLGGNSNGANGKENQPSEPQSPNSEPKIAAPAASPAPVPQAENAAAPNDPSKANPSPPVATPSENSNKEPANEANAASVSPEVTPSPPTDPTPTPPVTDTSSNTPPTADPTKEIAPVEPFKQLLASVDLPEYSKSAGGADAPPDISLGKVSLSAETKLKIELVGGDKVIKEPGKFLLQDDSGTGGEQAWLISRSESRIKPPPVARLKLEGSELYFEWVPIVTPAQANSLRNCGLLITAGEAEHFVQLRAPKSADPLKLNLDLKDRGVRVSLQLENPPPASRLRLKLLDLNDPFPASNFEPGESIGPKNKIDILFTEEKYAIFSIRTVFLDVSKTNLILETCAFLKPSDQTSPSKLDIFRIGAAEKSLTQLQDRLTRLKDKLNDPHASLTKDAKNELSKTIPAKEKELEQNSAVLELAKKLNGQTIHYRVFADYGNRSVELFDSRLPSLSKETAESPESRIRAIDRRERRKAAENEP